jgi:hypothetical protein
VTLPTQDPRGPTYCEPHRHRCEVRQVLQWRVERGSNWVRQWINGGRDQATGKPVRGVRQVRGDAAADRRPETHRNPGCETRRAPPYYYY